MDSSSKPVDPENLVRAEDKPDMEAELPARGTSRSIKEKFMSLGSETSQVDYSQPKKTQSYKLVHILVANFCYFWYCVSLPCCHLWEIILG